MCVTDYVYKKIFKKNIMDSSYDTRISQFLKEEVRISFV